MLETMDSIKLVTLVPSHSFTMMLVNAGDYGLHKVGNTRTVPFIHYVHLMRCLGKLVRNMKLISKKLKSIIECLNKYYLSA